MTDSSIYFTSDRVAVRATLRVSFGFTYPLAGSEDHWARDMPDRTVRQVLATYTDTDGATRYGLAGETVSVHPDDVKRFDQLNGGPAKPEAKPAPKRRPRKA